MAGGAVTKRPKHKVHFLTLNGVTGDPMAACHMPTPLHDFTSTKKLVTCTGCRRNLAIRAGRPVPKRGYLGSKWW